MDCLVRIENDAFKRITHTNIFNVLISPVIKFNRFRYPDWPAGWVIFAYFSWSKTIPQHPLFPHTPKSNLFQNKTTVWVFSIKFTYHRVSSLCWCNYFWQALLERQTSLGRKFSAIKLLYIRRQWLKRRLSCVVLAALYHSDCMDNTVKVSMVLHFWLPFSLFDLQSIELMINSNVFFSQFLQFDSCFDLFQFFVFFLCFFILIKSHWICVRLLSLYSDVASDHGYSTLKMDMYIDTISMICNWEGVKEVIDMSSSEMIAFLKINMIKLELSLPPKIYGLHVGWENIM